MARVDGLPALRKDLDRKRRQIAPQGSPTVVVGYTAGYAARVHEDLEAYHGNGRAKFLEEPLRSLRPEMAKILQQAMRRGASFGQALLMVGLLLQRESQQLVPVDTGNLKGSAFTRQRITQGVRPRLSYSRRT